MLIEAKVMGTCFLYTRLCFILMQKHGYPNSGNGDEFQVEKTKVRSVFFTELTFDSHGLQPGEGGLVYADLDHNRESPPATETVRPEPPLKAF